MSRVLVCDACAKGHEIKCIGLIRRGPIPCAGCGAQLPVHPNGLSGGNPLGETEAKAIRANRAHEP